MTLTKFDGESSVGEALQNGTDVGEMIFPAVAEDNQVVEVGGSEVGERLKQVVHETLEGCRGTLQTKWHGNELVETKRGRESGFITGVRSYGYLPVTAGEVEDGEVLGFSETVKDVVDPWHGVGVHSGETVDSAEVDAET